MRQFGRNIHNQTIEKSEECAILYRKMMPEQRILRSNIKESILKGESVMKAKKILQRAGMLGLSVTALINAVCTYIFFQAFGRKNERSFRLHSKKSSSLQEKKYDAWLSSRKTWLSHQPFEEVFLNAYDGLRLYGRLYSPQDPQASEKDCAQSSSSRKSSKEPATILLCIHGYHSDGINDFAIFTPFYKKKNLTFCLVDDRAHGRSDGHYIGFSFHDRYDCLTWANYLANRFGPDCRIFLHGLSMGAATVLSCSNSDHLPSQVKGIISDAAFSSGWDQVAHVMRVRLHIPVFPMLLFYDKICRAIGGYSLKYIRPVDCVRHSRVPILFIHGDADNFVPTSMAYKLYNACSGPKQLLIVPGAAHIMSYITDPKAYQRAFTSFIKKCIHNSPHKGTESGAK